jgi:gamma-glutamyl hercynylcysteine S-oxide synthase
LIVHSPDAADDRATKALPGHLRFFPAHRTSSLPPAYSADLQTVSVSGISRKRRRNPSTSVYLQSKFFSGWAKTMMYCERCNAEFHEEMKYCKWCGQTLIERQGGTAPVQKCSSCATPIQPGWTFCNTCGTKLPQTAKAASSPLCLRCGAVVSPGASSCLRCGHRFTTERSAIQSVSGAQYCLTCGEVLEPGKLYCKTCGAPVQNASAPSESASQTTIGTQQHPPTLPVEAIEQTLLLEQPDVQAIQSPQQTEVYQSFKPPAPKPEPNATIDLRQQQKASPAAAEDELSSGKTIEYGALNLVKKEPQKPAGADANHNLADDSVLSASDLQVDPDPFTLFKTVQETLPAATKEEEFTFEITPLTGPPEKFKESSPNQSAKPPAAAGNPQGATPINPPSTMHLQMDALPFESTVQEDTGMLKPTRPTTKLTPSEYAKAPEAPGSEPAFDESAGVSETSTAPINNVQPPQQPVKQLPQEPLPVAAQQPPTQPQAKPTATPRQNPQPAAPWPQNQKGVAAPAATKKGGAPVALIAATILIIALGGAAIWWFVLRKPAGDVVSPNTNATTTSNANLSTANANTSTANANTNTTSTSPVPEGMVSVAAGEYTLGREDGDDFEKPSHTVTLRAFFLDRTEVTNAEYKKFIDATNYQAPPHWKDKSFPAGQDNFPVVQVNWQDANAYAQWAGKRLPTEAEWEAAARGLDGRKYPWGNQWNEAFANIGAGEKGDLEEVGKHPEGQSPCGALDMIGNVWEWTADTPALYPGNTGKLPEEANSNQRVIRGGAFDGNKEHDASYRGYFEATASRKTLNKTGFRCAKDAK